MSDGLVLNLKSAELVLTSTGGVASLVVVSSPELLLCPSDTEISVGVTDGGPSLLSLLSLEPSNVETLTGW